ncbi:LamB/YcsF family protein, partial [Clavibacter nebraskensis]
EAAGVEIRPVPDAGASSTPGHRVLPARDRRTL